MNGSDMRSKAAATFGKEFMAAAKPKPLAKNAAVASNKVSKDRPIPAFKVGGPVKADLPAVRKEAVMKRAGLMKDGGKPAKHVDGGRIRPQIIPIALKGSDISSMGGGDGQMRASLGGIGGSMRPDYAGSQGRMMQDLDREGRMTGEAGSARGLGLRVGTRFKDGGHVAKKAKGGTLSPFEKAFAEAREKGLKEFTFKTKRGEEKFNTRYEGEAAAPKPKAAAPKPNAAAATSFTPAASKAADSAVGVMRPKTDAAPPKTTTPSGKPSVGMENARTKFLNLVNWQKREEAARKVAVAREKAKPAALKVKKPFGMYKSDEDAESTGVLKKAVGGKVSTSSDTARKLATEMGGMKCGGKAGKYAVGGAGKMRKGQCDTPTKLAKGGSPKKEPVTGGSNTPMTPERREILRMTAEENARNRAAMAKPEKKAKGGAGKVRKGMMSQSGQIMQAVKPGKGIGGK
jgi:hypothetical protein